MLKKVSPGAAAAPLALAAALALAACASSPAAPPAASDLAFVPTADGVPELHIHAGRRPYRIIVYKSDGHGGENTATILINGAKGPPKKN